MIGQLFLVGTVVVVLVLVVVVVLVMVVVVIIGRQSEGPLIH